MPTIYLCIHCSRESFLSVWRISVPMLGTHRPAGPSPHIGLRSLWSAPSRPSGSESRGAPVTPVLPAQHYDGTDSCSLHAL